MIIYIYCDDNPTPTFNQEIMNRKYTFKQVRDMFFDLHPQFMRERRSRKCQNDYSCDCRCAFVDFVDALHKDGQITDKQAFNITLG